MKVGDIKFGFKLLNSREAKDVGVVLNEYEHIKSGGKVVHLDCEDTNNVMAIGFRTIPEDSTGVCHIIEHSVLCGSKKYLLKEPFVNLLKTSLNTFLNAFTASDWTMYPVASQTPKDFDNLMDVYLDAVFNPKSMFDKRPFLQEGWHLELLNENELPSYKGVVYNEMKGAMSSPDSILNELTSQAMYPDNCYGFNSGGEPDEIPNLSYEAYQDFYRRHYNPRNALCVLYGKMDIEDKLKHIDEEYYSHYEKGEEIIIKKQKPVIDLDRVGEYEIGKEEKEENNCYVDLCYAIGDYNDVETQMGWRILSSALLDDDSSPLKKSLDEAGLGESVSSYIDDDNIQPSLHISLEKCAPQKKKLLKELFEKKVKEYVEKGIDKKLLSSTINYLEFKDREMDLGSFPKGISLAIAMIGSFNYRGDLIQNLEFNKYYQSFREKLDKGYFESLLDKYILHSKHNVLTMIKPSRNLGEKKKKAMDEKMALIKEKMSKKEIQDLLKQTNDLIAYQEHVDTPKELKCLPTLKLKDIPNRVNWLDSKKIRIKSIKGISHEIETQGIVYARFYFDASALSVEELPYFNLLTNCFASVDTNKFSLEELGMEIKSYLGSFGFGLLPLHKDKQDERLYGTVTISALKENIDKIPELLTEVLYHSKFKEKKVKQYLSQIVTNCRNSIIQSGNSFAVGEASASFSKSACIATYIGGLAGYRSYCKILENFDINLIKAKFKEIIAKVYNTSNCFVSVGGDKTIIEMAKKGLRKLKLKRGKVEKKLHVELRPVSKKALIIPSQVSYNALVYDLEKENVTFDGSSLLFSQILRYSYLWDEVRVKGGAYGAGIGIATDGMINLSSYRDPNVKSTFEIYTKLGQFAKEIHLNRKNFNDYIIGALGAFDRPLSPSNRCAIADSNYLIGFTKKDKVLMKKQLLHAKPFQLLPYARAFEKAAKEGNYYCVGNKEKIAEFAFDSVESL